MKAFPDDIASHLLLNLYCSGTVSGKELGVWKTEGFKAASKVIWEIQYIIVNTILNGLCIFYTIITCTYVTIYSSNIYGPSLTLLLINTYASMSRQVMPSVMCWGINWSPICSFDQYDYTDIILNFKELSIMLCITSVRITRFLT